MKIKPSKQNKAEFLHFINLLNKNTFDGLKDYGDIMIGVMSDIGVSDDFNFREMALEAAIRNLENRLDQLKEIRFELIEVTPIIKEITRPKGS